MTDIKANEREFMSQVISWLNEFLKEGSYPFEVASSDPSVKISQAKTKFPDVQIWLNRKAGHGFCAWELKTPLSPVDDQNLLNESALKARAMNADYFVTCNMKEAILWRTPNSSELVSSVHRLKNYEPISEISTADDLWVVSKQETLKARIKEILDDLATLYKEGHLHLIDVDSTFFVYTLTEAVKTLWPFIHSSLIKEIGNSASFKNELFNWAVKQGIASFDAGEAFFATVSRQIVYRLLGKILFYLTLRRFRTDIPKLELKDIDISDVNTKLKEYFEIARQIDYQAVFEEDFPDKVPLTQDVAKPLINLLDSLNRYNFSHMPQDVIGKVFEKLIPFEERHALGQYFTKEEVVDLITAFCVRSMSDKVLDPTCGTGTFLIRAYDRLKNAGQKDHKKLLAQIWGIDIAHFPAELATINLYRQHIEDYANFPRVITKDFFEVKPNDTFSFPPPKATADADFMIDEVIPLFDAVVGNFPYIRQEIIDKRIKGYKAKLTRVLAEDWRQEYPELFNNGDLRLSGQADIYAYMFLHSARFLKEGGRLGIVTSNAWLDVAYGYELQRFFLKNFKIIAILESRLEPWFEDASVNTTITVLERCSEQKQRNDNNVKFVKIKKNLNELIAWDIRHPMQRWLGLDRLIHKIENAGSEFYKFKNTECINTLQGIKTYEDEDLRIRVIKQQDILQRLEDAGKTVKWGQYLRAPEIYFEILHKCKDSLVPLKELAEVRRGYTTGINEFFHLTEERVKHWGIEKDFQRLIVTSPKEIDTLLINPKNIKYSIFYCQKSKEELRKAKKIGALAYIKWGEKQITTGGKGHKKGGIPYPQVPSVQGRTHWYALDERSPCHFVINRFVNERFYFPINKSKTLIGDIAFEGVFRLKNDIPLKSALLNSCLTFLMVEVNGRSNLGDGLLTFYGPDIDELLVPKPQVISKEQKQKILKTFDKLLNRPIKPIFEELKLKDRQAFDIAVLEALGLDPKKYLKPLYEGLAELVKERINLAKSRKKVKEIKTLKDIAKLKEQILDEIITYGIKNFPEEFIDARYLKNAKEISVPNEPLKLGAYFLGQQEVISEGGFKYTAGTLEEAKFIIYAQKPNSFVIKLPKEQSLIVKAVNDYENYLNDLKAKLYEAFFKRTHDHKLAETLLKQVSEKLLKH